MADTLGKSDDDLTWRDAALLVGEALASVGPDGYYAFTQVEWRDWALKTLAAAPAPPSQESAKQNESRSPDGDGPHIFQDDLETGQCLVCGGAKEAHGD